MVVSLILRYRKFSFVSMTNTVFIKLGGEKSQLYKHSMNFVKILQHFQSNRWCLLFLKMLFSFIPC